MTVPLLDTHAWIWWIDGDVRLDRRLRAKLDAYPVDERPLISDISLWEVAMLVSLGRLALKVSFDSLIAADLARLPDTFHRDPADCVIVSTSRVHGLPVLTRDQLIAKSGLVRLWKG